MYCIVLLYIVILYYHYLIITTTTTTTTTGDGDDDIITEALDDTGFEKLMDTLALQPTKNIDHTPVPVIEPGSVAKLEPNVAVQLSNSKTGVGAAFYSEQGQRDNQEDRCLLVPDVAKMRALNNWQFDNDTKVRQQLAEITLACVFDGHSGKCECYQWTE